jgi:hypothetical protein
MEQNYSVSCFTKLRRIQGTFLILTGKYLPRGLLGYITLGERG